MFDVSTEVECAQCQGKFDPLLGQHVCPAPRKEENIDPYDRTSEDAYADRP